MAGVFQMHQKSIIAVGQAMVEVFALIGEILPHVHIVMAPLVPLELLLSGVPQTY